MSELTNADMVNFYLYDEQGRVLMSGYCPRADLDKQATGPSVYVAEGSAQIGVHYRSADGSLREMGPRPSPFHVFDYAIKQWVDPRGLDELKAEQWAKIKASRDAEEFGGFEWDGSTFDSDQMSQSRIQGAVQMAQLALDTGNASWSIDWTLQDNTVRTLTAAQMVDVGVTMASHISACHATARALRARLEAASTREEVEAIVWTSLDTGHAVQ